MLLFKSILLKRLYAINLTREWERIVNENRVMCIGLSATPERTRLYYQSLITSTNTGKLQVSYRQAEDLFFNNLREHVMQLIPEPGRVIGVILLGLQKIKKLLSLPIPEASTQ